MRHVSVTGIGAVCAIVTTVAFVIGAVLSATSGVQVLIPETGTEGRDWIADVNGAGGQFFVGAWVLIFMGFFAIAAFLGFYEAFKAAGPWLVIAPVAAAVGMTLVTVSHLVPIAMAYELAPGYTAADQTLLDVLASMSLLINYAGNALGWGVAVPLFAVAMLKTGVVPRWIGWLGLVVAFFAGWLGLFGPASSVVEGLSTIGFVGFFVFMLSTGSALLLRLRRAAAPAAPAVPT